MKPALGATLDRSHPQCRGLVAWFPLLERGGGLTNDVVNKRAGTITGADWIGGKDGPVLNFVAADSDKVAIASGLLAAYPFTLACQFHTIDTAAANRYLFSVGDSASSTHFVGIRLGGTHVVDYLIRAGGSTATLSSTATFNDGKRHLVCAVSRSATDHQLYIDGVSVATATTDVSTFPTLNKALIGGLARSTDSLHFAGSIADCRAYSRALTTADMQAIMLDPWAPFARTFAIL